MSAPLVSVVAPTWRDWTRARGLVKALLAQDVDAVFEIILVNNAPEDPPPPDFPTDGRLQVVAESAPGSYAARNRGAQRARGRYLAFTDSDCLPDASWLSEFLARARTHDGLISGQVQMFSPLRPTNALIMAEAYDYFFGINNDIYARDGVAATANLWVPRAGFVAAGGFDATLMSGGDVEFCKRFAAQWAADGPALVYCPEAVLRHPLRTDRGALLAKARRVAGGRASRDRWRALAITLAPPLVRLRILLGKPSPGGLARWKAGTMIFLVKSVEIAETVAVLLCGKRAER